MENQVTIRHATEDDLQPMLDVYNDALINTTAIYQEEPHTLAMRKGWFQEKQNAGIPVFAAEINRQFAGFSTYGPFRNWLGYRFTIEHSVYVKAGFRRLGIGRKLVQAVIDHGRESNCMY